MEVKKQSFFALSRIERASKLFIFLSIVLLINCNVVYGAGITIDDVTNVVREYNSNYTLNITSKTLLEECISDYKYVSIRGPAFTTAWDKNIYFYFYDEIPTVDTAQRVKMTPYRRIQLDYSDNTRYWDDSATTTTVTFYDNERWYTESGFYTTGTTTFNPKFEPGATNMDAMKEKYVEPYFEYSANPIAYTNIGGKTLNTYYIKSFELWSNQYSTNREIGNLYIDKDYDLQDLFMPQIDTTKSNLSMTNNWNYTTYQFFKHEVIGEYVRYSISLETNILTAPYIYTLRFYTVEPTLTDDFEIMFAVINEKNNNTGSGGTIVTTPSGDIISGEQIKDETTIGDLENTITEPYDPNKNILNEMDSGDILESMGYKPLEDPNADLWDTIINGLKQTLTGTGDVILEVPLRSKTITVNSKDIRQPENELKVFTGLFVNFWFLMQMFDFIKKTIDQINEGNLKVMHDVDADCYFF